MLLGKKNNNSDENEEDTERLIMSHIHQLNFKEAMELLKQSEDSFFATYNKALCFFDQGLLEKAIEQINKALQQINDLNDSIDVVDPTMLFEIASKSLDGEKSYLDPVSTKYALLFPNEMKNNLLRLLVDIWVKEEKWDEINEMSKDSKFENILSYNNVKSAIAKERQ